MTYEPKNVKFVVE